MFSPAPLFGASGRAARFVRPVRFAGVEGSWHHSQHLSSRIPRRSFTQLPAHAIFSTVLPEWRNWQTQQTQNLPGITPRVGSTPSSGTILSSLPDKGFHH